MSTDAQIVAALSPDGWVALPLNGGFTSHSGPFPAASRQHGDTVELCGRVDGTFSTGAGVVIGTLTAAFWPASSVNCVGATTTPNVALVEISTAGVITVVVGTAGTAVVLDGLAYRII